MLYREYYSEDHGLKLNKTPHKNQIESFVMRIGSWSVALLWLFAASAYADEPLDCLIEPHVLVDISSSEIGVIASVGVAEADVVSEGDAVATLQTDVERATFEVTRARAQANREIELLRREHDFNTRKRDRFDELLKQRVVSAQDVDEVRTAQDTAWLRLQAAVEKQHTAELEATRDELALARRTVHSPIDGVVVRRYKSAGEFVDGDPIVQLAQLDPLLVRVIMPISMYGQIQVGMLATVLPELPLDGPFVASVTSIDPMMDAATATLGVRLALPNPEHRLPPGLRCSLVFHPMEIPDAKAEHSSDLNTVEFSISAQALPSSDLPPLLGAAMMGEPVATDSPSDDSCVTIGPLQDVAVADTVSAVLDASKIRFARRYLPEENKRIAESTLWFDIVGNPNDPMHVALVSSIREYYPALLEQPIDCPQVESR